MLPNCLQVYRSLKYLCIVNIDGCGGERSPTVPQEQRGEKVFALPLWEQSKRFDNGGAQEQQQTKQLEDVKYLEI